MATSCDADLIFRIFTDDLKEWIIIDARPQKDFKKYHINQAFCVRLSTNGKVLAVSSQ